MNFVMCRSTLVFNKYIIFLTLIISYGIATDNVKCKKKFLERGKMVCVCDETHCDTISRITKINSSKYLKFTSSKSGLRFEKQEEEFDPNPSHSIRIKINETKTYQTILGWGGAFTDSAGINIDALSDNTKENLLRSYFSEDGIEYSLCRVPMGATDFSTHPYSYDDGPEDKKLENFELNLQDYKYKIPFIIEALKLSNGKLKLFASVWTAPLWMKTNDAYHGLGFLKVDMFQTWADYFIKFLESYERENIKIWGITTGNEPSLAFIPTVRVNTVGWLPEYLIKWITNNLGPTLRNSKFSDTKLMVLDDQRTFLPVVFKLFQNKNVKNYTNGIAVHWYNDAYIPPVILSKVHEWYPEKFILYTEACNGVGSLAKHVDLGSWERGEAYASSIITTSNHWSAGWVDWNIALDTKGGPNYIKNYVDSPVIVNKTSGEFYKQPMFYAIGHFSKFVPANSTRIFSSSAIDNVLVAAFKRPDGGIVINLLNKNNEYNILISIKIGDERYINVELEKKSLTSLIYW